MKLVESSSEQPAIEMIRQEAMLLAEKKLVRSLTSEERKGIEKTNSRRVLESLGLVFAAEATTAEQVLQELNHYALHPVVGQSHDQPRPRAKRAGISYRKQRMIIRLYAVVFLLYAISLGAREHKLMTTVWFSACTVGPAVPYLLGARWGRWLMGCGSTLLMLPWVLLPMAQHSIDRTTILWLIWACFGAILLLTAWASFTPLIRDEA